MRKKKTTFLSSSVKAFLKKRFNEGIGMGMILLGLFLFVSFFSYDRSDPSMNTAVDGGIRNLAGLPGSMVADFFMQMIGKSCFVIAVIAVAWGRLKVIQRPISYGIIKIFLIFGTIFFISIGFTTLPMSILGPEPADAGGVLGIVSLKKIYVFFRMYGYAPSRSVVGGVSFFLGFLSLFYILGLRRDEWIRLLTWGGGILRQITTLINQGVKQGGRFFVTSASLLSKLNLGKFLSSPLKTPVVAKAEADHAPVIHFEPRPEPKEFAPSAPITRPQTPRPTEGKEPFPEEDFPFINEIATSEDHQLPPLNLLSTEIEGHEVRQDDRELSQRAAMLKEVLEEFGVRGEITNIRPGPVVTLYELVPAPGIKSSRVIGLSDDIARSMSALSARVAVISGRNAIGIELPNPTHQTVHLRELIASPEYEKSSAALALALGKDIGGAPVIVDLARMPHLLVAGTTGSGKSVSVNSMILSLIYRLPPNRCKMILIDPKMLELSIYNGIPHLLSPVVTDPKKAVMALKWTVQEMENRYRIMSKLSVRNIQGYNHRVAQAKEKGEEITRHVQTGFDPETGRPIHEDQVLNLEPLPYIVVVVDEMADLMLVAGKDIEAAVQRLAQMARAAGIHLIMATQRPSVDVITGTIKANFPVRVSFQVTSKIDSRTILGEQGAEQLLGRGDMLYMAGGGRISRVHGPFVSDEDVHKIVAFEKSQSSPSYIEDITEGNDETLSLADDGGNGDDLYQQAVALVHTKGKASTSFVQRHLQIGYNRAATLIERMEDEGIISPANHVGKREVLGGRQ